MKSNRRSTFLDTMSKVLGIAVGVAALGSGNRAFAQALTPMYTFEAPDDLNGFIVNSDFPGFFSTITLNTDTDFVSEGVQSLKWELINQSYFEGAQTPNVDTAIFNDPLGVDFIRFDLINTTRLVPEEPVAGVDPTFANMSVNFYGEFASNPGETENIQFFGSEVSVGEFEPGTHEVDIDLTGGGLLVGTSTVKGLNEFIADGLTIFGFQIYLNKSFSFDDPAFAWTIYLDNVRAGRNVEALQGDYNGDHTIDAADYTVWRDAFPGGALTNDNDGIADQGDYTYWKDHFGESGGSGAALSAAAAPEPSSLLLVFFGGCCCLRRRSRRTFPLTRRSQLELPAYNPRCPSVLQATLG
jgi:hypothetical protein